MTETEQNQPGAIPDMKISLSPEILEERKAQEQKAYDEALHQSVKAILDKEQAFSRERGLPLYSSEEIARWFGPEYVEQPNSNQS